MGWPPGRARPAPARDDEQAARVAPAAEPAGERAHPRGRDVADLDALLTPAVAGDVFVRVPFDGGAPVNVTSAVSRVSLFSAAWSTNGYAYGLDVDGGSPQVAVIDRRGNVTWQQLPASALDAGLFGPLSHIGLTAMADGRLISCGCRSSSAMILTPRSRRTLPVEVMTSPWLNKW